MCGLTQHRDIWWAPRYTIFADGSIYGPRGRLTGDVVNGYRRVLLRLPTGRRKAFVHRLVCEAFHGPSPSKQHHAAHIDGDRQNNTENNLRWATAKENEADKIKHGTVSIGERNGLTDLTAAVVREMRADRSRGLSFRHLGNVHNVSKSTAFNVCSGVTWGHIS